MAVLGSSDFALHEAQELANLASGVTIYTDGEAPNFSREHPIAVNTMKIQAIEGEAKVTGIRMQSDVVAQEAGAEQASFTRQMAYLWQSVRQEVRRLHGKWALS